MQNDVTTIKERLNIVDFVGEYVRLAKAGANHKARCPFHEEKSPSFIVTEERGTYHCFGCGKGGDIFSFLMEIEGIEFREALTLLAERAGVELQKFTPEQKAVQDERVRVAEAMVQSVAFYESSLWDAPGGEGAKSYLRDRGLSDAIIRQFQLGYAPDGWHNAEQFLLGKGFTEKELTQAGIVIQKDGGGTYDRFRHRVMFPISDVLGRPIGYSARAMPSDDDAGAKYINTPESPLYHKSDILYGIDLAKQSIKREDQVVLVEGNMDVIAAHEAGISHVVGVSGTALTENHIKILKRYTNNFTLFFDADDAGQKAAHKSTAMCLAHDIDITLVSLSEGKDAADIVRENPDELKRIVANAQKAIVYFIAKAQKDHDTSDPRGKRFALEEVLTLAAVVSHPVERTAWIQECVRAFDVDEETARQLTQQYEDAAQNVRPKAQQGQQQESSPKSEIKKETSIEQEIVRLALAFPEAWQELDIQKENFTFIESHTMLSAMMREGPPTKYDALTFLTKATKDGAGKYGAISAYREEYERSHGDELTVNDDIIALARRAQAIYESRYLASLTAKLKAAENDHDHEARSRVMKEITDLTTD